MSEAYKRYNDKSDYSYSFGPFPTFELLNNAPERAREVLIHSQASQEIKVQLESICRAKHIPVNSTSDKVITRIRDKESCLVVGVFEKYESGMTDAPGHIVLVNPSDMGNLGTIIRTAVGFGIPELAIIRPGANICHPKTVRASMGSLFSLNFQYFDSFSDYLALFGKERKLYPFMLEGSIGLDELCRDRSERFALIFGNEATGLPAEYAQMGQSVRIRHTDTIDSLNLSLAAGIGIYEFTKG